MFDAAWLDPFLFNLYRTDYSQLVVSLRYLIESRMDHRLLEPAAQRSLIEVYSMVS